MDLPNPRSRRAFTALALVLVAGASVAVYRATRPDILFLGFPSMYRFLLAESSQVSGVRYDFWTPETVDDPALGQPDLARYAAIYVSGRRSDPLPRPVRAALDEAGSRGARVIVLPAHDTRRLGVGNADFEGSERWIDDYWRYGGVTNMARLLTASEARFLGEDHQELPPEPTPDDGFYHPDSPALFASPSDYEAWYASSGLHQADAPKVMIDFADGWRLGMNQGTDAVIRAFETGGFNAAAYFGTAQTGPFAREYGPDILVSRKHGRWWLGEPGVELLESDLDVPVLRGLSLLFTGESFSDYSRTRAGIRDAGLVMGAVVPELDGAIQPTLIEGLDSAWYGRRFEAYQDERIQRLLERARRWVRLRRLPNAQKRIAVLYVSGVGKGRITAAGLNVPGSLIRFLETMRDEGYAVTDLPTNEEALLAEMLDKGRNVSAGRPSDLQALADRDGVLLLPTSPYKEWFGSLPEVLRNEVVDTFGPPPGDLMTLERDGRQHFVVPKLDFGEVMVLPQPVRGANMDAALQHNDRVPPPHQYLAVYWWLREVWRADAIVNFGTHGTHEFLPGRPLGQLSDDWSDITLGSLPSLYVYVVDNVGEALIAKRRGGAVTVSHQIPPVDASELSAQEPKVAELFRSIEQFQSAQDGALKEELRGRIRSQAAEQRFDHDIGVDWSESDPTDAGIDSLGRHIHLIDEDRIPVGLHMHGRTPSADETAPMIAAMLGPGYLVSAGCRETAEGLLCDDEARAKAAAAVRNALAGSAPSGLLSPHMDAFERLREAFERTPDEVRHTLDALEGRYVPPGGGGDPLRNPQALPTGRNLHGINPAEVPTKAAWELGVRLAQEQLEAERERLGRWPRRIGFTLWNTELIRQHGTDLAHAMHLMGVRPVWDHQSVVEDVELIPAAELGRPRIDVVIQAASLFRDTFPDRMKLLDKAARLASAAADGDNYLAEHAEVAERELKEAGLAAADARILAAARIFSNAAGGYGTGLVAGIERSGGYASTEGLTEAYLARTGAVYTEGYEWGASAPEAYRAQLGETDAVTLSRSTNVVGALTLDHYFEYLGGMTMAVKDTTGTAPETYVADVRNPAATRMETVRDALVRDMRGKFWNPKWIRALQEEGFSGAVEIAQTATNLFGWQVTKADAVGPEDWDRVHEVYVEDALGLDLPAWFDDSNPFGHQELMAILLEAARKEFWSPDAEALASLAVAYGSSLARHGASGSPRTTGNRPLEEFLEVRIAASDNPRLASVVRDHLRDGAGEQVEGRRLVSRDREAPSGLPSVHRSVVVGAVLALGVAFLIGWRRRRRGSADPLSNFRQGG